MNEWVESQKRDEVANYGMYNNNASYQQSGFVKNSQKRDYKFFVIEKKKNDMAIKVGDNIVAQQTDNRSWSWIDSDGPSNDITGEMVAWLDEIHQAVGHDS